MNLKQENLSTGSQLPGNLPLGSWVNKGILPLIARSLAQGPSLLPFASLPKAGYVLTVTLEDERYRKDDRYERRQCLRTVSPSERFICKTLLFPGGRCWVRTSDPLLVS